MEIVNHRKELEEQPFHIVITGDSSEEAYNELGKYNLQDFKNLTIDSTGIIKRMTKHGGLRNPRLTIVRNNSVALDSIYSVSDIESVLIPKMLSEANYIEESGIFYEVIHE
jgi:hypothetical protein